MSNFQSKLMTRLCLLEMWERFGYYGIRALLTLFIIKQLGFNEGKAYLIYGLYAAICYIIPILGGFLADRLLGYKNLLLSGSIFTCLGHFVLTFLSSNEALLYLGIAFVAVGTGFFKGNISNMLGSIYGDHNNSERDNGFRRFYIAINFGSFCASILCGIVAEIYGWKYGFGLAGVGAVIGFITLIASRDILRNYGNPPKDSLMKIRGLLYKNSINYLAAAVLVFTVTLMFFYYEASIKIISVIGGTIILHLAYITTKLDRKSQKGMVFLVTMIFFVMVIFALEMQLGSFINIFTDKHVKRNLLGITIPTASLQALNPLTIILLGSGVSYLLRKTSTKYSLMIFGTGIVMSCICFAILYFGCNHYDEHYKINIAFLVIAMMFLALSEIMMAPIIQSVVTYIAPEKMRGYMMGFLLLCLSYSNLLGSVILKYMLHIDKGKVDNNGTLTSLLNYQECFLKVTIAFVIVALIYVALYKPMIKIYSSFN